MLSRYRQLSLGWKILIFMMIGAVAGIVAGERAEVVQPLGDLFIRLLMMAVIPLVFFNLLAGIASLDDARSLGRVAGKIIGYYLITTTAALTLGLAVMHFLRPGSGMQLREEVDAEFGRVPDVADVFLTLIPENVVEAFATGQVAQVVVFAIFLGVANRDVDSAEDLPVPTALLSGRSAARVGATERRPLLRGAAVHVTG